MRHYVIGTAGHIDHGKSALVKALTGTDPDRLEEEKRRGMTIDLGFAHFDLPSGRRVGIVDVPGHDRFIKNMLAGATGIDLVLLVIAADEGIMPQTREHLDILRFLPVRQGIVVLSKVDLASDPEWIELLRNDVAAFVDGTFLSGEPVVEVSAKTGQGVSDLIETIDRKLDDVPSRGIEVPARLPVDRSFTMPGFGTVVTGTLWSGKIATGDALEILPQRLTVRVRGVQSHGNSVNAGTAGSRVAVNLVGIEKDEIQRGDVLSTPGVFQPASQVDVRIKLLHDAKPLVHLARIRFHLGTDEAIGRVYLLDRQRLQPGEQAIAQIRLEASIVAGVGDPFVLRRYSPMHTIGGGEVLTVNPPARVRGADSVQAIEQSVSGFTARLEDTLQRAGFSGASLEGLQQSLAAARPEVEQGIKDLEVEEKATLIHGRYYHSRVLNKVEVSIAKELDTFHAAAPWRMGMPRSELKSKAFHSGDDRLYTFVVERLAASGQIEDVQGLVRRPGFNPQRSTEESALREQVSDALNRGRFSPPSLEDLGKISSNGPTFSRVFQTLLDDGTAVDVGAGIVFHRDILEEIKRLVASEINEKRSVTVASLRDRLGTSRKFALTVLEYLDRIKVTRRVGDARILVSR
jgi:selenocysteine-specific elongation factor